MVLICCAAALALAIGIPLATHRVNPALCCVVAFIVHIPIILALYITRAAVVCLQASFLGILACIICAIMVAAIDKPSVMRAVFVGCAITTAAETVFLSCFAVANGAISLGVVAAAFIAFGSILGWKWGHGQFAQEQDDVASR